MFTTLSQFQFHVDQIAEKLNKNTVLQVKATFNDDSVFTDIIEREQKQISRHVPSTIRDYEGQTVEAYYSGGRFVDIFYTEGDPMTVGQTKKNIIEWLNSKGEKPVKIEFALIED